MISAKVQSSLKRNVRYLFWSRKGVSFQRSLNCLLDVFSEGGRQWRNFIIIIIIAIIITIIIITIIIIIIRHRNHNHHMWGGWEGPDTSIKAMLNTTMHSQSSSSQIPSKIKLMMIANHHQQSSSSIQGTPWVELMGLSLIRCVGTSLLSATITI